MNYFNPDYFTPTVPAPARRPPGKAEAGLPEAGSREAAAQIAALLGRCLPVPDTPELSYLRCFVTLAFEEATTIANRGNVSAEELEYIASLDRAARDFTRTRG